MQMNKKRNRTLLTLSLLAMSMAAGAQQLVCNKLTVDCGQAAYQVPVSATFELKNTGARPLTIDEVKADCGCTTINMSKDQLASGETAVITLTYDAKMLGHFVKQALVNYHVQQSVPTNDPPVYLTMKGVVLRELKDYSGTYPYAMGDLLTDKDVLEFDDVNKGDHPEQELYILNNSNALMTPNIEHLPPYLTAMVSPEQLKPGQQGKVVVTLNSQFIPDYGLTQSTVYLASHLGDKVHPDNELPVSVVLLPDLTTFEGKNKQYAPKMTFSAPQLEVGMIGGKQKKKAEIVITNNGRMPLEISSIQMFTGGVKLTLNKRTLQPQEQTKMKITVDLNVLKKSKTRPRVLMITNDPDQSKVILPINVR